MRGTAAPADFDRLYPPDAAARGYEAEVELQCRAAADGKLLDCGARYLGPYADQFKDAAVQLASPYRLSGQGACSTVTFSIRFLIRASNLPPVRAAQPGAREGAVDLDCRVSETGDLENCFVALSDAGRADLYDAAFKVGARLAAPKGAPHGLRVVVPIHVVPAH